LNVGEAIFVREIGGPEVLRLEAHDPGEPGPGAVRVRVAAAGVNFIDIYFRTGVYPRPFPFVCGLEGAGTVETAGAGVSRFAPGDRVAWAGVPGSYASHVVAPADRVVAIPTGVADDVAAAAMLQGMTAHYLTHGCREARPGDVALVHAAAGGTGLLLVQMLAQAGVTVIGTCSTEEKAVLARDAGADHVIRYSEENFAEAVQRLTDGRGADVVYDSVGQSTFEGSLRSLRPRGLLVLFGQSSGVVPPFDLNRLNAAGSLFVTRPSLAHYTQDLTELEKRAAAVLCAVADGKLTIRIGAEYPLSRAADAQRALESRATTGKLLLRPA
jgi:NADPH2:quinone reductase